MAAHPSELPAAYFRQSAFLASAGALSQLPPEGAPEIAVAGRSNVGKSSAINALVARKRLAYASKTPGRTQTLNFFDLGGCIRLVDLPGYGYAQVPLAVRAHWEQLVGGYLHKRASLAGIVIVMDARRPFAEVDQRLIAWLAPLLRERGLRIALLLAKSDQMSRIAGVAALDTTRRRLAQAGISGDVVLFSSRSQQGVAEARSVIQAWLPPGLPACTGARRRAAGPSRAAQPAKTPRQKRKDKKTPGKGE